jgi:L-iditol 2-dehydrogenase
VRVARLHGIGDLRVEEAPDPGAPGPGEARVRVTAVGICGSDLHYYREGSLGDARPDAPLVLGHEFAARVEAVGAGVALPVGARVAVEPGRSCGRCELCEQGHPNLCPSVRFCASPPVDGALQEFMLYPAALLFPLPRALSDADGAALEPLGIGLHALRLARLQPGETVAVLGGGCIGLLLVQLCRVAGASRIFVTEPLPHRREAARRFGATDVLDPASEDVPAAVLRATGGRGVDIALEAAGAPDTPAQAVAVARPGGIVILVGIPSDDTLTISHAAGRRKGLTLKFARRAAHTYPRAVALAASGAVDLRSYVTHRYPLEAVSQAFHTADTYADGALKVVVDVTSWE